MEESDSSRRSSRLGRPLARLSMVAVALIAGVALASPVTALANGVRQHLPLAAGGVAPNDNNKAQRSAPLLPAGPYLTPFTGSDVLTSSSTSQTGRLFRDGIQATCGTAKTNPGNFDTVARRSISYGFTNTSTATQCIKVTLFSDYTGTGAGSLQAVAYNASGYNPADPSANYLADSGNSSNYRTFSFNVAAGANFFVAVSNVDPTATLTAPFTLEVGNTHSLLPIRVASTSQYSLASSNGTTWSTMDGTNLLITVTPLATTLARIQAGADLWTANAGFNQDLGIMVSCVSCGGLTYPTVAGQPEAWKESGGFAGTFSPNAAFVSTEVTLLQGVTYTIALVWKANKPASGATIFAGAGPIGGKFSPTSLTVALQTEDF